MDKQTSLGKALGLLSAIGQSADPSGASVADLMRATGLSRPTTYRFLSELQDAGMVTADPRQPLWRLGPKIVALAAASGNWTGLRRRARQEMEGLMAAVGHTVHFGIRDGNEVVYIDKAESPQHVALSSAIGQRRAISTSALGKCLVAFDANPDLAAAIADAGLPGRTVHSITTTAKWLQEMVRVRAEGVAYDVEECDIGVRCVAAPVLDGHGGVVAAISVSALAAGRTDLDFDDLACRVRGVAERIGAGA